MESFHPFEYKATESRGGKELVSRKRNLLRFETSASKRRRKSSVENVISPDEFNEHANHSVYSIIETRLKVVLKEDVLESLRTPIKTKPYDSFYVENLIKIAGWNSIEFPINTTEERASSFLELFFYIIKLWSCVREKKVLRLHDQDHVDGWSGKDSFADADADVWDPMGDGVETFVKSKKKKKKKEVKEEKTADILYCDLMFGVGDLQPQSEEPKNGFDAFDDNYAYDDDYVYDRIPSISSIETDEDKDDDEAEEETTHFDRVDALEGMIVPPPIPVPPDNALLCQILSILDVAEKRTLEWKGRYDAHPKSRKKLDPSPYAQGQGTRGKSVLGNKKNNSKISPNSLIVRNFRNFVERSGGLMKAKKSKFNRYSKQLMIDAVLKRNILYGLEELVKEGRAEEDFSSKEADHLNLIQRIGAERAKFENLVVQCNFAATDPDGLVIKYVENQVLNKPSYRTYHSWLKMMEGEEVTCLEDIIFNHELWNSLKKDKVQLDLCFLDDVAKVSLIEFNLKRKKTKVEVFENGERKSKIVTVGTVKDCAAFRERFWEGYKANC